MIRPWLAVLVVAEVALDQVTKHWADHSLGPNRHIEVAPTLDFDLSYNRGFSFGTGAGQGRLVALLVMAMIVVLLRILWREERATRAVLLAVILGGALGNLIDRFANADDGWLTGHVVDFIDVHWYAVFNVADIFVVGGVTALFVSEVAWPLLTARTPAPGVAADEAVEA